MSLHVKLYDLVALKHQDPAVNVVVACFDGALLSPSRCQDRRGRRNHRKGDDGLLGSRQEVGPERTVRDPESEERQPDRSERYVSPTWRRVILRHCLDINLFFTHNALLSFLLYRGSEEALCDAVQQHFLFGLMGAVRRFHHTKNCHCCRVSLTASV